MKERYRDELNWFERLLGVWRVNRDSFDTKWGYFAPRFGFEFIIGRGGYFDQRYSLTICLLWGVIYLKLPFKTKLEEDCEWPTYGFNIFETSFILNWGDWSKYIDIPFFSYVFEYHKVADKNGKWFPYEYEDPKTHKEVHDYTYVLNSGVKQERKATCYKEVRQWHRKWIPFIKMRRECIDIHFNNEVGEESGSWKGGCLGCGYNLLKNESIESCLRRMEKERKF